MHNWIMLLDYNNTTTFKIKLKALEREFFKPYNKNLVIQKKYIIFKRKHKNI